MLNQQRPPDLGSPSGQRTIDISPRGRDMPIGSDLAQLVVVARTCRPHLNAATERWDEMNSKTKWQLDFGEYTGLLSPARA
jgi:hypothetical protein